jgi:hypothetical protein
MKLTQLSLNATLRPGESKSFSISGMKAIQQLSMEIRAANLNQALRSTVQEIAFDGEKTVCAPVDDFYGIGYMPLYASTWYTQVEKAGQMSTFWVMPFEKACTITLHNLGQQEVTVANASADVSTWKWDNRSMHFGAAWQQFTHIHPGALDPAKDINFATLQGKGVYVGDGVALYNTAFNWWGEGDEKVFVDGEKFPSHFGTGTEDYYGYAWCRPETFTDHPFIAQPYGMGSFDPEYSLNTRLRALDRIPFLSSLSVDMEIYQRRMNYAPVSYWYIFPGGQKQTAEDISGAKEKVALKRMDIYPAKLTLGIEGEDLDVPQRPQTGGLNFPTHLKEWSGGKQLLWERIRKGSKGYFSFNCDLPGEYVMHGLFTKFALSGTFNVYVNDRLLAPNINLYDAGAESVTDIELGKVTLKSGNNTLVFELVGYPDGQAEDRRLGVDRLYFAK